jgi:aminoglycoside phosphotransferase (APT) family kinase protein
VGVEDRRSGRDRGHPRRDRGRTLNAAEAVPLLSQATGERYELVGRLTGGETGAHELRTADGRRVVAKWELQPSTQDARRRAISLSDRLREQAGWPVPRSRAVEANGCLFVLQAFVAGAPVRRLTHSLVDELVALHAARVGLERTDDQSRWPDSLVQTLTVGGSGYCRHESLRGHDRRTAELVARIERIGAGLDRDAFGGGDVVHWDLHPGNLLEVDGRLAAVIDTDFATTGDATFDLATLAVTSLTVPCEPGVRGRLFDLGVAALDRARREAYLGHLLLRFVDWSIRKARADEVEFWLEQSTRLLPAGA